MVANEKPASTFRYNEKPVYTTSNGYPIDHPSAWQRVGTHGPLLLQDFHLIDLLAHFDRERIPERVVHARGGTCTGPCIEETVDNNVIHSRCPWVLRSYQCRVCEELHNDVGV